MNRHVLVTLTTILILSMPAVVNAQTTVNVRADDSLFVTYEFANLDPLVYEQARIQFPADRIPKLIADNLEAVNQTIRWGLGSEPLTFDDASRTIRNSFFLGGSSLVSFTLNRTTLRRVYEVETDWRKFKVNLTDSYSVDYARRLATPASEWQKPDSTTFYYENKETDVPDVRFYLVLPASASRVRVLGDTVFYDAQPYVEDQLLGSPFLILVALVVALVVILVYRKVR